MARSSISTLLKSQLSGIRKEIAEHEKALRALKKEESNIQHAARLLTGKGVSAAGRRKRGAGRRNSRGSVAKTSMKGKRTNWETTVKALPSTFTMDDLAKTRGAKGKSRAYLHQIINRLKKAGTIKSAGRATYQKA